MIYTLTFLSLFFLLLTPVNGKESGAPNSEKPTSNNSSVTTSSKSTVTPTTPVKNQVATQNQGEDQNIQVKTQEETSLNKTLNQSLDEVSTKVQQLADTIKSSPKINQELTEITDKEKSLTSDIKSTLNRIQTQSSVSRFLFGSDKNMIKSMEQQVEQNRLLIQQLEQLKSQIKNSSQLTQLQETLDLMIYQNTSLEEKISQESKLNGIFGWFINLINQ